MTRLNTDEILSATLPYLQFIHDYHNDTVSQGKALRHLNDKGQSITTTVFSRGLPYKGKYYEVPAYDRDTGKILSKDELFKKYMPMLESGELQEMYGDFGIPAENYGTIMNLYQRYKRESGYGNIPDSAIKYDRTKK